MPTVTTDQNYTEVTAKEIESVGSALEGKGVVMVATFFEVDDLWAPSIEDVLKDDTWAKAMKFNRLVGFTVIDRTGDPFVSAFASKEKYGRILLQMKQGKKIRLSGRVKSGPGGNVLLVVDIQP